MPSWNQVLEEIKSSNRIDALDDVRRKYLKKLSQTTGRNTIAYYSGWLQKPGVGNANITDDDKNGLMAAIHKLDRERGLDLILHTPGGDTAATESIVNYLRKMFGTNMRAIVPQIAMSAGTMIACACDVIIMGKQSNIGPIDPQFGGIPAQGVIAEFKKALEEVKKDPATTPIWQVVVGKYHPTFIEECSNAIDMSASMVKKWLCEAMFKEDENGDGKSQRIVNYLMSHQDTKTHARHIHIDEARDIGLLIRSLEDDFDDDFQDTVLTIHHAYMHTFGNTSSIKIVENQLGNAIVSSTG
ncbi:MAG: S49 family peptidase [Desulfuromonadales bacterium]|nr:S49 family peptidase [Desulfuromonadales bacterium]